MGGNWDKWNEYRELAQEALSQDADLLIQQAEQLTEEGKRLADMYDLDKPYTEAKQ